MSLGDNKEGVEKSEDQEIKPTVLGGMVEVFRSNIGDTIAYLIITLGLIILFFEPFIGGIPVGTIMGLYFSRKAFEYMTEFKEFLIQEGIFRGFIIIASVAALVISAPGLCLGILIGSSARPLVGNSISTHDISPKSKE